MNALVYTVSGGGKTVCSTLVAATKKGRNKLLCSDNSHIVLNNEAFKRPNLDIEVVSHWLNYNDGKSYFNEQFEKAVESGLYDNIIVDNISDVFDLGILEFDETGKVKDPRQYYLLMYQAFKRLVRKAGQLDCNVIFTAWTDLQTLTLPTGEQVVRTQPKLPNKILDNFLGLAQIVAYVTTAEHNGEKKWYYALSGNPTLYAKDQAFNRKSCLPADLFTAPQTKEVKKQEEK